MANFIGLVFATLKKEGIETKNLSIEEAIAKYNEITNKPKHKESKEEPLTARKKNATIHLNRIEYAKLAHAIATKFTNESKSSTYINLDKFMYLVTNIKPGQFTVKSRADIEEFRD